MGYVVVICYIKSFKTFETIAMYDVTDYEICWGEKGTVSIFQKDAVQLSTAYIGAWCIIDGNILYISDCSPDDSILKLTVVQPEECFTRPLEYDSTYSTYQTLILNGMTTGFQEGSGDSVYAMPYLSINVDTTATKKYTPTRDDYGYYSMDDVLASALKNGISIKWSLADAGATLKMDVTMPDEVTGVVVFGDGHSHLEDESYEASSVSKMTVVQKADDDTKTIYTYYLTADHKLVTSPPAERAPGIWKVYGCSATESPLSVATGALSGNINSHKIEFYSDQEFEYYQPIKLRLRGEAFSTYITAIRKSSTDKRTYYKCGNLAVSLTDKIKQISK